MKASILVVEDERIQQLSLKEALSDEGFEVFTASNSAEAESRIERESPNLVLLDIKLRDSEHGGMEILRKLKLPREEMCVIMMTEYGSVETAVEAMKLGAFDYIPKPFNLDDMKLTVRRALETLNLKQEVSRLRRLSDRSGGGVEIVTGGNARMAQVCETIRKVAASRATTVLIEGESGTGKELVARSVHNMSDRADKMFVAINCTALPEHLLEAELFGYEKGAFTDARQDRKGLFELADEGSLFLDEIGDMSLAMQAKMLRALQEKKIRRVGGSRDIVVDIRIIASTNKNLEAEVRAGKFREDLYYRLKVVPVYVPPLRERREDVFALIEHFVRIFNREFGKSVKGLDPRAQKIVIDYPWPGNVRELKNVVERAILLESHDTILPEHLNLSFVPGAGVAGSVPAAPGVVPQAAGDGFNIDEATVEGLDGVEKYVIERVLVQTGWNKNLTAKRLKINRTTLYNKIKKYNLSCPDGDDGEE